MTRKHLYLLGLLATSFALQSCIDDDYDLDDIDMTISTDADLSLPLSSTGDILLRNIMEEGEVVKFVTDENGQKVYAVIQDGSADIQEINIPTISISPTLNPIETDIRIDELINGGNGAPRRKVHIQVGPVDLDLPDAEFHYTIQEDDNAKYEIVEATAEVDPVVRSLEHVSTKDPVVISLDLNINGLPKMLNRVYLDNFMLTVPTELEINGGSFNGVAIDPNSIVNGRIPLTGNNNPVILENGATKEPIRLSLSLTGVSVDNKFKFTPNPDPTKNGLVSITGNFEVDGSFRVNTADIDSDKLNTFLTTEGSTILSKIVQQNSLLPLFGESIHISGNANITDIVLGKVTGSIARDIADIQPIMLDDLPDFLNDSEVVLDLDNPAVLIKTFSNIPGIAQTGLTLTSNYDNGEDKKTVQVSPVNIAGTENGTESRFYIADKEPSFFPEGYTQANTTKLPMTGSVKELIRHIPKQVDVDVDVVTMYIEDMDITRPYKVGVDYQVFAPLIVGPDFKLVYSDTERGWAKDLDDAKDVDAKLIELKAEVTSDLPADLEFSLVPIDRDAREISGLSINAVTVNANAKRQAISFAIQAADPERHSLNDFIAGRNGMQQLDGIQYKAVIKANQGSGKLYESAKIKLDNIKITIKGGITYDAN